MGYCFHKKDGESFSIRLSDASVVRAAAGAYVALMPEPNGEGRKIPRAERDVLVEMFREQSALLSELATYFEGAEDLRWA